MEVMNDTTTDQGMQSSALILLNVAMPRIDMNRVYDGITITAIMSATSNGELSSLCAEDYPVLAKMWGNDEDAAFDNL